MFHIKEAHFENFRGFKDLKLSFNKGINVLIGGNGSGKSSVLDGLAIVLVQQFIYSQPLFFTPNNTAPWGTNKISLNESDINYSKDWTEIKIALLDSRFRFNVDNNPSFYLIDLKSRGYMPSPGDRENFENYLLYFQEIENGEFPLPLLMYYQTDRSSSGILSGLDIKGKSPTLDLFGGFMGFVIWFKVQEDLENQTGKRTNNYQYRHPSLEAVRSALECFLTEIPEAHFSNLRFERDASYDFGTNSLGVAWGEGRLVINKDDIEFNLDQLSAGEKLIILTVSDIARRMFIVNPTSETYNQGAGIVLIDEIELHLHPKWQRAVLPALHKTFPNVQFIVTTHSPQVLSEVKDDEIIKLRDWQAYPISVPTYGRDSNAILDQVMEVGERPEDIKKLFDEYFELIARDSLDEARKKRQNLEKELGRKDDPLFTRADAILNRKRLLNK